MLFSEMLAKLKQWDKEYAKGKPSVSDDKYDLLRERAYKLKPKHSYFAKLSTRDAPGEKVKLPNPMMSLSKIRPSGIMEWATHDDEYLASPKLDGLSGKIQYKKGKLYKIYTRGDGEIGRDVTHTAKFVNGVLPKLPQKIDAEFNGEFIVHRSLFAKLPKNTDYKAPRNFVVGMLNTKEPRPELLSQMTFICYSVDCKEAKFVSKLVQWNFAATHGFITITNLGRCDEKTYAAHQAGKLPIHPVNHVGYKSIGKFHFSKKELSEKVASFYLTNWRKLIDIDQDGIVLEVASTKLRNKLGADDTPNYAVAIKPEIADHETIDRPTKKPEYTISSRGLYKPVAILSKPAVFNGVEVSRITLHNAKFVKDMGIGEGAILSIIRSGEVIPRVVGVKKKVEPYLPTNCFHCKTKLQWTKTETDLWCSNTNCEGFQTEKVIDFFQRFKVDKLAIGTIKKLIAKGYNTVPKIMRIEEDKLAKMDGLGPKSAKSIITNMRNKLKSVSLADIMHASSMFSTESAGLGTRRAKTIIAKIGEKGILDKPIDDALYRVLSLEIDGIGETLADQVFENLAAFREFYRELPIGQIAIQGNKQGKFAGKIAVWSGYRSKEEEAMWEKNGGEVGVAVTKKTSVLFTSTPGSSKSKKAMDYGVRIIGKNDAINFLDSK
jgi:DNA ligase (NAD+)